MVTGLTVYLAFPKEEDAQSSMCAYSLGRRQAGRTLITDVQAWGTLGHLPST